MQIYEILESTSELRIKVFAKTKEELFQHALIGMFDSIVPVYVDKSKIIEHEIMLNAKDQELLLIDFLTEALYLSDINNEAFFDVKIMRLTEQNISATIIGKKVTDFAIEIKAVTYHGVHFEKNKDQISVDILFDI